MHEDPDESPLVSVVIPTYYRNDCLPETVKSVIDQSYDPLEVIVVDDSGEAHAEPVVERFDDVEYVAFSENCGANAARTAGAMRSRGRYVHFLDDDDRMFESKIRRQVQRFQETDAGVVYTGIKKKDDQTDRPDPSVRGNVRKAALAFEMWPCMTSTMLIERDVLTEVLPLSDRVAAQDLELMIQLAVRTEFEFVDEALLYKRIETGSLGSSLTAVQCRKQLVKDYDGLYTDHPSQVHREAMARNYEKEGALLLQNRWWSPRAITALLRHWWYMPDETMKSTAKLVAACFGRPGWWALDRVNRAV